MNGAGGCTSRNKRSRHRREARLRYSASRSVSDCGAFTLHPSYSVRIQLAAVTKIPTAKQGQYLAFLFYYTKIHRCAPAEADMQQYFRVTPPSVHQMVLTLEADGFIERIPGKARSIRLLIAQEDLPTLE
jgi:hypothetical protein